MQLSSVFSFSVFGSAVSPPNTCHFSYSISFLLSQTSDPLRIPTFIKIQQTIESSSPPVPRRRADRRFSIFDFHQPLFRWSSLFIFYFFRSSNHLCTQYLGMPPAILPFSNNPHSLPHPARTSSHRPAQVWFGWKFDGFSVGCSPSFAAACVRMQ